MEVVIANRNNLASILMGKNIQFTWRGQKNVMIKVPFSEWLQFIQDNKSILINRSPLDYQKVLNATDDDVKVRHFLYDISWALYSELANSSDVNKDATLILPHFDDGVFLSLEDIITKVDEMDEAAILKCHNSLKSATRNYFNVIGSIDSQYGIIDLNNLSEWNMFIFKVCLFLQSRSSNKVKTEKLNIDWRLP